MIDWLLSKRRRGKARVQQQRLQFGEGIFKKNVVCDL